MHPLFHRLGFIKLSRGAAVLLVIIGIAVAAAFYIGPFRPLPSNLHLAVSNATMSAPNTIFVAARTQPGSTHARFPFVLAASNNGAREAMPTTLNLSIPSSYRLSRGVHSLSPEIVPGNPLAHYTVDISGIELPADSTVYSILPDTLWLEPKLDDYDCTISPDSVPEFVPPQVHSAGALSRIPIFYSFDGTTDRQTGMFTAEIDSTLLVHTATAMPPQFPMYQREPEAPRPDMGPLHQVGTRTSYCGDPQDPLQMYTVDWETDGGGRFLVVYVNGVPRKQLFDLDRDSVIELEMWDPNNDGKFEAWHQAQYAIPTTVLPERSDIDVTPIDSLANDPRWITTFGDTTSGVFRFLSDSARARRVTPPVDTARADSLRADSLRVDSVTARPPVVDTAFIRTFYNTSAGPYRFLKNPPARRAVDAEAAAAAKADSAARVRRRPRSTGRLGRPVAMPPLNTGG